MNMFARPAQPAQPVKPFEGVDYIRECELTLAREDVQRLKSRADDADVERAVVADKLSRLRRFEKDLLVQEAAIADKIVAVNRMLKAKERLLFDLEQDGGAI